MNSNGTPIRKCRTSYDRYQNMSGKFRTSMIEEETTVLTGSAPVSLMRGYQKIHCLYRWTWKNGSFIERL